MNLQNTHFNYVIPKGGEEPFKPSNMDFSAQYYCWPRDRVTDVKNRYFNAFYNLDKIIKNFADFLKEKGIWDRCYFVIIGDSGEGFYEHGFGNHSGPMYEEVVRTFCLIKPPNKNINANIINYPVSHIDVFPGILDLMGLPSPPSFQGISPFCEQKRQYIYMHTNAIVIQDGIINWPWKLLLTLFPFNGVELYNLQEDPDENDNLAFTSNAITEDLKNRLHAWRCLQLQFYQNPNKFPISYYPPKYQPGFLDLCD